MPEKHPSMKRYPPELKERAVRMVKETLSRGHDYPDLATWDRPEAGLDLGIITDPRR